MTDDELEDLRCKNCTANLSSKSRYNPHVFTDAINRAMESCKSAEIEVSDHLADVVKMVEIGSNAVRDVDDIMLEGLYE